LLHVENGPIKHGVITETLAKEQLREQAFQIGIIGAVIKSEGTAVLEVGTEFRGEAFAKLLGGCRHLPLQNPLILLFLGVSL